MNNLITKVIGSCALLLGMFCWIRGSREYFIEHYPHIFWTFIAALIATFLGVILAFWADNYRQEQIEENTFKFRLAALLVESSDNLKSIRSIREGFTFEEVCLRKLGTTVAVQTIADPSTFKYGQKGLIFSLSVMIDSLNAFNSNSGFVIEQFYKSGKNLDGNLKFINISLDQAEYRIKTLQSVLDYYNIDKYQTELKGEANFKQIWQRLLNEPDFKMKLKKVMQAPTNASSEEATLLQSKNNKKPDGGRVNEQ